MPRQKSLIRTILEPIAIAVALAFLVRAAVQIYAIPTGSMSPTLEPGDRVVVTRYFRGAPERGHIVVFRSPVQPDELLVKRVVGVAGDSIDSRAGRLRIGGRTLPEPYVLRHASSGAIESQVVPAGTYYVLGDNRDDSSDSRVWGAVPETMIVGRARMVLWSSGSVDGVVQASGADPNDAAPPARRTRAAARSRIFKCLD